MARNNLTTALLLTLCVLLGNSFSAHAEEKSFGDATVKWERTNQSSYKIEIYNQGNLIFDADTKSIAGDSGRIETNDVILHTTSDGKSRFVAFIGIGIHNDIFYVIHLSPSGQGEWKVDGSVAEALGKYGCGQKGMKQRLNFDEGVGTLRFWVGNNENSPCRLRIAFENGKIEYKPL